MSPNQIGTLQKEFSDYLTETEPTIKAKFPDLSQIEVLAVIAAALFQAAKEVNLEAARYRWSSATEDNASTLHSILLCHAGDQAKIDARIDEYRAASQVEREKS